MLTTHRRDRRIRRQALFTLESLDDRLVLSAVAAGAVAEAAGAKAALIAHRHEARIARHEARLARIAARHASRMPTAGMAIPVSVNASTSVSASTSTPTPAIATAAPTTSSAVAATPSSTGSVAPSAQTTTPASSATNQSPTSPLPTNVAAALQSLYTEYQNAGSGDFKPNQPGDNMLQISGNSVAVSLKVGSSTDFNTALSQLQSDGMQVSSSSSTYGLINGMIPISALPAAAQVASSVTPVHTPQRL